MTRLSEELLDEMERDNADFVELVRGYRQFRGMLREWVAEYPGTFGCEVCDGPFEDLDGSDRAHTEECVLARTEVLLAGESEG